MEDSMEDRLLGSEEYNTTATNDLKTRIWTESKKIWRVAFPGMVARVTSFGLLVVTQVFLGRIGELELAAYAIEQTIFLRFINGILIGMSSATETLCGQAFGAEQYHMLGIYLQRSWIVDGIIATVLLPLFIFTAPILILIGQEKDISLIAGKISLWFIPFIYYFVFSLTMQMYLQAQMKNMIVGWVSAICFAIHVPLSWFLVTKLELGINGAMGAVNISGWLTVIGLFVYVFGGWCPDTWKGFTFAAFTDILPVVKLSISSGIMICLELWYNSILLVLAGYLKNATTAISAFSICVRVSNELGRGNATAAKFSIRVILCTSTLIGLVFFILCLVFDRQISYIFTTSEEVADTVSDLSPLLAFSILLNSIQPVLSGVAIGAGLQNMVAIVNLGCYYVIGIPVGFLLGYVADLQVKGLWIGLLSGVAMQTFILSFLIWKTDWNEQVNKASERLDRWLLDQSKDSKDINND
ncbi:protein DETOXIFICATION 24 isoform X2 [Jatropha curcas]|uniref:protein DETOXIFICATION 24 isoform X2 n=1 Tax=Jatropha curcas TaxID=180498 RepID=UPI0009D75DE6|nr:protein DETOXIFICATION 24 isoform X2 [Jatropha curcas]